MATRGRTRGLGHSGTSAAFVLHWRLAHRELLNEKIAHFDRRILNTAPLGWGFTDGPLTGKYDLSFTVPSKCADALRNGEVDVAIIPSIEYQRIEK